MISAHNGNIAGSAPRVWQSVRDLRIAFAASRWEFRSTIAVGSIRSALDAALQPHPNKVGRQMQLGIRKYRVRGEWSCPRRLLMRVLIPLPIPLLRRRRWEPDHVVFYVEGEELGSGREAWCGHVAHPRVQAWRAEVMPSSGEDWISRFLHSRYMLHFHILIELPGSTFSSRMRLPHRNELCIE